MFCKNCKKEFVEVPDLSELCSDCLYCVFIPQNTKEFVIGNLEIMESNGIGFPKEREVFYGTANECQEFVNDSPFDNFIVATDEDGVCFQIYSEKYYRDNDMPADSIVLTGDYDRCAEYVINNISTI